MCVNYFSSKKQTVQTAFLGLIRILVVSTTGQSLLDAISNFLKEYDVDIHDCIGLGTDGENNVPGEANTVLLRFRDVKPDIQFIKYTCQSLVLCAEKALSSLPLCLEHQISAIPSLFNIISLRREDYKLMNNGNENYEDIVSLSATRWLVQGKYVYSLLILWEELKVYFSSIVDKTYDTRILVSYEANKFDLTFACPIIQNFEALNADFQTSNPDSTKQFQELEDLRSFLLQKLYKDSRQQQLLWLLSDYKLGGKSELDSKVCSLSAERKQAIKQRCRDFI